MIDIAIPALILFCIGVFMAGGAFGIIGCCCAMSGEISRQEECANEGDGDFADPLWVP